MPNWKENGWRNSKGQPVVNKEAFQDLDRAARGMDVQFKYVPRHQNSEADELARQGARKH
jgi:ribonuclease HI